MIELQIGEDFEFGFNTHVPSTGEAADAAATPTYRVYVKGTDTVVANGNCSKRDDGNTTGFYIATGTLGTSYAEGSDYMVRVSAGVAESTSTTITGNLVVGYFRVVAADVLRSAADVATAVAEKDLAGYEALAKSGTKLGNMLALLRGRNAGKFVITATTTTGTLTVYEADNVTIMATYDIPLDYDEQGAPA